jgi:hypothetical protein
VRQQRHLVEARDDGAAGEAGEGQEDPDRLTWRQFAHTVNGGIRKIGSSDGVVPL